MDQEIQAKATKAFPTNPYFITTFQEVSDDKSTFPQVNLKW